MTRIAAALAFAAALVAAGASLAADDPGDYTDMQVLRKATADRDSKRAFVESALALTAREAKQFWPIYDQYQRDLDEAGRVQATTLERLVARDRPITDKYAQQLASDVMEADRIESDGRRKMQRKVLAALPKRKAARYIQLESKFRAAQLYDIAVTFPLIQ